MLENYWYIACASSQLDSQPVAVRILGKEVVIFRDGEGGAQALLDRCCHRGVKLSLGQTTEGALACGYHGWRYDGSGQCVHIPSLCADQRIPKGYEVQSFVCREKDSYVWVWMGEGQPTELAGVAEFEDHCWYQGSIPMQCDFMKGVENNLDWCHPYFAHPFTHPQFFAIHSGGFKETSHEIRLTNTGMVVFGPATSSETDEIPANVSAKLSFELPDRVRVESSVKGRPLMILMHFVPTDEKSCRLEWLNSRLDDSKDPLTWSEEEPEIFKQDRLLIESAQFAYDREGKGFERSVEADTATLLVRQIVKIAAEGRWEERRSLLPQRRIVRVRA